MKNISRFKKYSKIISLLKGGGSQFDPHGLLILYHGRIKVKN